MRPRPVYPDIERIGAGENNFTGHRKIIILDYKAVRESRGRFPWLDFMGNGMMVLDRLKSESAEELILRIYGIGRPRRVSPSPGR